MPHDTVVAFDQFRSTLSVVTHIILPESPKEDIQPAYDKACAVLQSTVDNTQWPETPLPTRLPKSKSSQMATGHEGFSNVGR
jgi:anthranilate synthase component 1